MLWGLKGSKESNLAKESNVTKDSTINNAIVDNDD